MISDESTKKVYWKVTFSYCLDFLQIESKPVGTCLTHFDSISCLRTCIGKVTFNKVSGECLAPDSQENNAYYTSLQLLKRGPQLVLGQIVLLACHSGHLPKTLKQLEIIQSLFDKPGRDSISGRRQCLVLVGWAGTFISRLASI